ncbi:uncharacterized protein PHALS_03118 [Plasmopara halstedii]|uniref:Uncharacterized protein n=1 Tax=Plasmopara halstedii TaxID=4781 RepID=A0A0P1A7G3_PLAHL|nr:uncharacterized protein PHALS_03118 [Plasmopara halstedii]CEG36570.1 hypothetical protein PHALS_03118 [Plasmopara halstedii]|eukprot:XP_024572939.1 hypothetical protein PHALS_03118 [Plasmopara halstedii]
MMSSFAIVCVAKQSARILCVNNPTMLKFKSAHRRLLEVLMLDFMRSSKKVLGIVVASRLFSDTFEEVKSYTGRVPKVLFSGCRQPCKCFKTEKLLNHVDAI